MRLLLTARAQQLAYAVLLVAGLLLLGCVSAQAAWVIGSSGTRTGEAKAAAVPSAPTGVAAACTSALATTVKVTWTAVTHAANYKIWQSTTSSTSGFTVVATGVTGTTWTSGTLANGNYWFEVSALVGSNWTSSNSAASGKRTISAGTCA